MPRLPARLPAPRCSSLRIRALALTCACPCPCIVGLAPYVAASQQTGPTDPVRSAVVTAVAGSEVRLGSWPAVSFVPQEVPDVGER